MPSKNNSLAAGAYCHNSSRRKMANASSLGLEKAQANQLIACLGKAKPGGLMDRPAHWD
jgi:hypothetical protein